MRLQSRGLDLRIWAEDCFDMVSFQAFKAEIKKEGIKNAQTEA